jgi:hypothetical protein
MSISTYFRPNIHQTNPEILGIKKEKKILSLIHFEEESDALKYELLGYFTNMF